MISDGRSIGSGARMLSRGNPFTWDMSHMPSARRVRVPNEMPFETSSLLSPMLDAVANLVQVVGDLPRKHFEIARTKHARRRPRVPDGLGADRLAALVDTAANRHPIAGSNVTKSKRCASTKTLVTKSPPPPTMPNGALWQP